MAKSTRAAPAQSESPRTHKINLYTPFEHAPNRSNPDPNVPMVYKNQPEKPGYPMWAAAIPSPKGISNRAKGLENTYFTKKKRLIVNLNPPDDYIIKPQDMALVIAREERD